MANDSFNPQSKATLIIILAILLSIFIAEARQHPGTDAAHLGANISLRELFLRGGWAMWPILGCFLAGGAVFCDRALALRRRKHAPPGIDKDIVHTVDTRGVDTGLALCLEKQSSLARVLYAALLCYGTSRQEMEAAIRDEGARLLYDLRRNCRWLQFLGNLVPLLGLLGTTVSLVQCFDAAGAAAQFPASGVAAALLPAAFGLIAAIPLLTAHQFADAKAEDVAREVVGRGIRAIITLDRKARRSIQLLDDIEEHLETQEMAAAKAPPNLDAEFEEADRDKLIKTSVTTRANQPVVIPAEKPNREETPHAGKDAQGKDSEGGR